MEEPAPKRIRSKNACLPCKQRKRKCDENIPCYACKKYGYKCVTQPRLRATKLAGSHTSPKPSEAQSTTSTKAFTNSPSSQITEEPIEANSGAALAKSLGLPPVQSQWPRLRLVAWNVGLRDIPYKNAGPINPLTSLLSQGQMLQLAAIYFSEVQPIYGFLDKQVVDNYITSRWSSQEEDGTCDALLCGIASLGCLFSGGSPELEEQLYRLAAISLEPSLLDEDVSEKDVVGWLLKVMYLRFTGTPHATWMATSTMMHLVEAVGLHREPIDYIDNPLYPLATLESRRRIYTVAQLFNNWVSFDCGRTRVEILGPTTLKPQVDPNFCSDEMLQLSALSDNLAPSKNQDIRELEQALHQAASLQTRNPLVKLLQCNVVFCIYRRLRAMDLHISCANINVIIQHADKVIQVALDLLNQRRPWWHMSNLTFQVICTMLAIDSTASVALLAKAVETLERIRTCYSTATMIDACAAAKELIALHRQRKSQDIAQLDKIMGSYGDNLNGPKAFQNPIGQLNMAQQTEFDLMNISAHDWDRYLNMEVFSVPR